MTEKNDYFIFNHNGIDSYEVLEWFIEKHNYKDLIVERHNNICKQFIAKYEVCKGNKFVNIEKIYNILLNL